MSIGIGENVDFVKKSLDQSNKMEYSHRGYNPFFGGGLVYICGIMEEDGWMLSHVVAVTQFESIAVFSREVF